MVARVLVLRLQCVGKGFDRRQVGPLQLLVAAGVGQRQRCDVGDSASQSQVALAELVLGVRRQDDQGPQALRLPSKGRDQKVELWVEDGQFVGQVGHRVTGKNEGLVHRHEETHRQVPVHAPGGQLGDGLGPQAVVGGLGEGLGFRIADPDRRHLAPEQ